MSSPGYIVRFLRPRRLIAYAAGIVVLCVLFFATVPRPDLYQKYSFSSAVYDRNGKFANNVPGVVPVWVFAELSAAEHEGKVPVYSDYE